MGGSLLGGVRCGARLLAARLLAAPPLARRACCSGFFPSFPVIPIDFISYGPAGKPAGLAGPVAGHRGPVPGDTTATEISVAGANCAWCLNEALDALRATPGVTRVATSMADECVVVDHPGADLEIVLDTLRHHLHGASPDPEPDLLRVEPQLAAGTCRHGQHHHPVDLRVVGTRPGPVAEPPAPPG
jgi:hypothetical protein